MPLVSIILPSRPADIAATIPPDAAGSWEDGQLTPAFEAAVRSIKAQSLEDADVVLAGATARFADAFTEAVGKGWASRVRTSVVRKRRAAEPQEHQGAPPPIAGIARARNAGVSAAEGSRYLAFLDPGDEWAEGHLEKNVGALEGDASLGACYCRYTVRREDGSRRTRSQGRAGRIFEALIERRHLFLTPSVFFARRDVLVRTLPRTPGSRKRQPGAFDETLDGVSVLDLFLRLSLDWDVAFADSASPVVTPSRRDDEGIIERRIRIFISLLYGAPRFGESVRKLVRGRLAHELVQLGKLHYRRGDYDRAGRLFNEAAKAAPRYVKGRRYQFLNYVREKLRGGGVSGDDLDAIAGDES